MQAKRTRTPAKEPYYARKIASVCKQKSYYLFRQKRPIFQAKALLCKRQVYLRYKVTNENIFFFENVSTRRRRNPCLAALVTPSLPSSLNSCSLLEKERAARDERRSCARGRATAGRVTWWSPSRRRT
jgi:hypothetical protein